MIEVKNLTKRYGNVTAVDNLSFTVEEGQVYGFLGPNGAGKSTTMNIMTGYLASTEGEVIVNGHDITEEPEEAKKTIGYLPEIPPLYPEMTVREYLNFVAELKKVAKKDRKDAVASVMDKLVITDVQNRLIRNLSKGYRQRVGFAQALIGDPETLILDEPTVGLDPKQIIEIRELITALGKDHTVILSSHILSEVSEICDTVLIISQGKLVALDTPENLSKSRNEHATLHVVAQGSLQTVLQALNTVLYVTEDQLSIDDQNLVHADLTVPGNEDIRGAVSKALFAANCPIYEMNIEQASLEKLFLELTDTSAQKAASDEETELPDDLGAPVKKKGLFHRKSQESEEKADQASDASPDASDCKAREKKESTDSVESSDSSDQKTKGEEK